MKIRKAVITAAGLGTRVLPASKAMPKEMIPIVDKPAIQYIVEECVKTGITDILIILSRGKHVVEDHFDRSPDLEKRLSESGKDDVLKEMINIAHMANLTYVRQQEQLGLGHAVLCAENFVGDEPFAVLYGDDVIIGEDPAIAQLCRAYDRYEKGIVGIREVPTEDVMRYSSMKVEKLDDTCYGISDMIEKPKPEQIFSNYSILGRCVLPPEIFGILKTIPKGANNELQLTDAMKILANSEGMIGVDFTGNRYDMGNKLGILKAAIDIGLSRPDLKDELAQYIKLKAEELG
ncbi:MAG: UTP--glucose-1-phosphate uridylyltransferase GalU [Oscillospiraceae bacterium]|nr:UTP--glucose-1-phosphate uridylyltransferase GalU [Oscillospiraceae bacterium]